MGGIDDDFEPAQGQVIGKGAFAKLDVAACRIIQALCFAQLCCSDPLRGLLQCRFDGFFRGIGQLGALGAEELDAVVGDRGCGWR